MAKIISLLNFKGGVGKTTSTHSIGSALSVYEKKVLLIDMDPQGTLTFFSMEEAPKLSVWEVLAEKREIKNCIEELEEFDLLPSTIELTLAELELNSSYNKEFRLKRAIDTIKDKYDYVLIDCPPSLSIFTLNALAASTDLIIPCECELASMEGLNLLLKVLKSPIKHLNPELNLLGILPTKLDRRKKISGEVYEMLKETHANVLPAIRINSKLSEIGIEKISIFKADKTSKGAKDYRNVAEVILNGN